MIRSGIWKHYKGHRYLVLGTARHTETNELLVVYVPLYEHPDGGPALQCRPVSMWEEIIEYEGKSQSRFVYEGDLR